jgi:hypothetical protein
VAEVTEVDPTQALAEAKEANDIGADQAPDVPVQPEEQPVEDVIDILKPKAQPKEWTFGPPDNPDNQRTYIQRPLSYFGKMQFFALVGEVIDKALAGDNGLRLGSFFEGPRIGAGGMISMSDFSDAETFLQAVAKLLVYAPDFLERCYCIWLSVPDFERPWAREMMSRTADEGGLSDDDGIEIVEIFLDQNWESIDGFFARGSGFCASAFRCFARSQKNHGSRSPRKLLRLPLGARRRTARMAMETVRALLHGLRSTTRGRRIARTEAGHGHRLLGERRIER